MNFIKEGAAVEVIFLDIYMPETSGIELAKKIRELGFKGFIVFLSMANDFAVQSYEVGAFSYLIKPATKLSLQDIINEIEKEQSIKDNDGFKLTWRGGGQFILFSELMYVEVRNHHLYFHLRDGEIIKIYGKLKAYTDMLLADPRMVYNNRSFVFNMDYIGKCESGAVFLKNGVRISIPKGSEKFRNSLFQWVFDE